jgi:hypothetical protein
VQRISLKAFRRFCNRLFHLDDLILTLTDLRKKCKIPLPHIFYTLFYTTIINENNFLAKDKIARKQYFKNFIGSIRKMVASDSTLERNIRNNLNTNELNNINISLIKSLPQNHFIEKKLNRKCIIFDGSGFGNFLKEIAFIPGKTDFIFQSSIIPKKGKELPSAYRLMNRIKNDFGKNCFDLAIYDGLYYTENAFNSTLEELGAHVLVKTSERLSIVNDALEIIGHFKNEVTTVKGYDYERNCSYEISLFKNIKAPTIATPVNLAIVNEIYKYERRSGLKKETFYAITSDLTLEAEDIRYGSHLRWRIENNGFKQMNALYHSKRKYSKNEDVEKNLTLIIFLAYNLFHLYLKEVDLSEIILKGKTVFKDFVKLLYESLIMDIDFENSV